jgi:hypothetical protein
LIRSDLIKWPEYKISDTKNDNGEEKSLIRAGKYIIFKTNQNKISRGYSLEQCQFWNSLLPNMIKQYSEC